MKRSPLRAISRKRANEQRARVRILRSIDADQQVCERCHFARATDAHEVRNRSQGGDPTDLSGIKFLCRECHRFITEHPRQAIAEGYTTTTRGY